MAQDIVAKKGKKDQYANVAYGVCTQTAANTLTFVQMTMAVGLFQGIALLIHRILWQPYIATMRELVAATDVLQSVLASSNRLSSIGDINDPAIIAQMIYIPIGAVVEPVRLPLISDFTMLPGGGKLTPANPLWIGLQTAGFAAAGTIRVQLDFTFVELADRDYLELIQSQFPANI